jgi:hypothetical protein
MERPVSDDAALADHDAFFVIVGPPRSGTSALAWALRDQGVSMAVGTDAPDIDSPTGNQEDNLARTIHNQLMGRSGAGLRHDWDHPRYVSGAPPAGVRLLQAYVRSRQRTAGGPWGVKDPRLCFLIEPWHAATSGQRVHWLHIQREDRHATVCSLLRMLPEPLRSQGDRRVLYRLVSNWAESFHLACELGFARTGIDPFAITYEELLTTAGQSRLSRAFGFTGAMPHVQPAFNRQHRRARRFKIDSAGGSAHDADR